MLACSLILISKEATGELSRLGKKLKHEKSEETKHGLSRDCFLGAPERTRN
jgi:hypothetical protein